MGRSGLQRGSSTRITVIEDVLVRGGQDKSEQSKFEGEPGA